MPVINPLANPVGLGSTTWRSVAAGTQLRPSNGTPMQTIRESPMSPNRLAPSTVQRQPQAALTSASNYVPPHLRAGARATPSNMDQAAQQLGSLRLGAPGRGISWNASNAPRPPQAAPSMLTCHFAAPGQANSMATVAYNSQSKHKW